MSKKSKFISIALDLLQTDGDWTEQAMAELEQYLSREKCLPRNNRNQSGKGECEIYVMEDERPCIAQVKFFPLRQTESKDTFHRANGRIDLIREMTDETGRLALSLPAGSYVVEISKGSEYGVIIDDIVIEHEKGIEKSYQCRRYVNLPAEGFYAGDLHHHSIYSSPVYGGTDDVTETPEEVCGSMRAMGLSFGALSDHHNILNHEVWKKQKKKDFTPIISKEISTSNGHVIALGVAHDVIYRIPEPEERTESYLRKEFIRITDEIKQAGGLAQLNHPRDASESISWNPKFYDMISIFETIEVWNGSHPMCAGTINAKAGALWRSLLEQQIFLPATTGSDTHNIKANDYHGFIDDGSGLKQEANKKVLSFLEEWAETNLTTGGVRTYVNLEGEPSSEAILEALRLGKSFLTNGPVLIPSILGKSMGETVALREDSADIAVKIYSNHKLSRLDMHSKGEAVQEFMLEEKEEAPYYDYSMTLAQVELKQTDFVFFVVSGGPLYLAITNPIFIKRKYMKAQLSDTLKEQQQ